MSGLKLQLRSRFKPSSAGPSSCSRRRSKPSGSSTLPPRPTIAKYVILLGICFSPVVLDSAEVRGLWQCRANRVLVIHEVLPFQPVWSRRPKPLVGAVSQALLGVKALRSVELHFKPGPVWVLPAGVDSFVLRIT